MATNPALSEAKEWTGVNPVPTIIITDFADQEPSSDVIMDPYEWDNYTHDRP